MVLDSPKNRLTSRKYFKRNCFRWSSFYLNSSEHVLSTNFKEIKSALKMALYHFIWNQSFWIPGRWGEVFDLNRFGKHRGDHHEYLNALFLVRGAFQAHTFVNMAEIQNNLQVYQSLAYLNGDINLKSVCRGEWYRPCSRPAWGWGDYSWSDFTPCSRGEYLST